nr:sensor histidine kinase [Holdemania massiliensis]
MKFRTRMIVTFSTLITIAFAVLMSLVYLTVSHANQQLVSSTSIQLFDAKAREAGDWLAQRVSELEIIALNPAVQSMDFDMIRPFVDTLNADVGQRFGNQWGTFAIGKTDGIGWVAQDKTIDVSGRDYFERAMTGDEAFILSEPVTSKTDNAPIALICYPLRKDGVPYGFINGAIALNRLTELAQGIDFYGGVSWIMDSQGRNYTVLPETLSTKQLIQFSEPLRTDPPASTRYVADGSSYFYFTPIPMTEDWFLCTQVPRAVLMESTYSLLSTLAVVWIFLLGLTIFAAILLSRTISQPLAQLCQTMNKAGGGDLTIRAQAQGSDEIAMLAHSFNKLTAQLQQLMNQLLRNEKQKRRAELRILQAQINPHFLYNTLDMLHWMAYDHEDQDMLQLISTLSSFYRISLSRGDEFIPLPRELDHVRYYLEIQKMRFEDQFDFTIQADAQTEPLLMLKLLLQPLAENAVIHGIKPCPHRCQLTIEACRNGDVVKIRVSDNGVGIQEETLQELRQAMEEGQSRAGFGLVNVHQRIRLTYGADYGLTLDSGIGQGTTITLRIPAIKEKKHVESIDL